MIDIHCHILPNVDDGSTSLETSLTMLKTAEDMGITDIILTPHYRLGMFLTPAKKDVEIFEEFKKTAKEEGINVNLFLGQEVHYNEEMADILKRGEALTLNGGKYLLLEFDFTIECDIPEIVYRYMHMGYKVIVAHYERYKYATLEGAMEIKSLGAEIQINAYTVLGKEGGRSKALAYKMLDNGLVDYVASDVHSNKDNDMLKAYQTIQKKYGKEAAEYLFKLNAEKIIK